jgi:hypothetical protein
MKKIAILFIALLAILLSGGLTILTWDMEPPSHQVEKTLPNSKFPK